MSNTEKDDDDDDVELANKVDSDHSNALNTLRNMEASSSKGKGKGKAKGFVETLVVCWQRGKKDIHVFSTLILAAWAQRSCPDRLRTSRKNILVSAGLGIKESCCENIANLHA